ncbi:MAG: hypothetical protein ACLFWL_08200 [Candidatus Brocadiia bacterium]
MDHHANTAMSTFRLSIFATLTLAVLAIAGATHVRAEGADNAKTVVGIYEPQRAFQQYPGRAKLMKAYQSVQKDMAKAREEGDQQKTQQLQQQLQQKQEEVIEEFENKVEKALPTIARKEELKLVATEVVYTADNVETKDVTTAVMEAIGGGEEEKPRTVPRQR